MPNQLQTKLDQLFSLQTRGIKPGLTRINNLLDFIGHPETNYPIIHVAGTNGKGSTCRIIHAILKEAGYKVGLYTSPHLLTFNERIKINDELIRDEELLELFEKFDDYMDESKASFFEITTAMALKYFSDQKVDIVILEVGLGGRFDATNAVVPKICAITSIGKDHEEFLGIKIEDIAMEKAGIIKENVPVIVASQTEKAVLPIIKKIAVERNSEYFFVADACNIQINQVSLYGYNLNLHLFNQPFKNIYFPLIGKHQIENLTTALSLLTIFPKIKLSAELINSGLKSLQNPARFELINEKPEIIYDVAHNISGIKATIDTAIEMFPSIDVLIAMKASKNLENLGLILKDLKGKVFISEIPEPDSKDSSEIYRQLQIHIEKSNLIRNQNLDQLLEEVMQEREKPLLILGSHYMAKNIYKFKKAIDNSNQ